MKYGTIKKFDIANGVGIRTSLFVSGCRHGCKGCFNEIAWSFTYGHDFDKNVEDDILDSLSADYVDGLSLLGGEPFEVENQKVLVPFLRRIKERYPNKSIWCWTGFYLDKELWADSRAKSEYLDEMLSYIDVLVDGRFILEQKDISLQFRGSKNQRIIDLKKSLLTHEVILLDEKELKK